MKGLEKYLRSFVVKHSNRFVSRWLILLIDLAGVSMAYILAYLIRVNFNFDSGYLKDMLVHGPVAVGVYLIFFLLLGSYKGIIRHTSATDVNRVVLAASFAALTNAGVTLWARNSGIDFLPRFPHSINLIHYLLALFGLLASRFLVKVTFRKLSKTQAVRKTRILIYGVGDLSQRVAQMFAGAYHLYEVKGFIADAKKSVGQTLLGIRCLSMDGAIALIKQGEIDELVVEDNLKGQDRKRLYDLCLEYRVKVKNVPPIDEWIEGKLQATQLKQVAIEDLLGRSEVNIHQDHVAAEINGKSILVTGAAGSIGSEIVRQLLRFKPRTVLLLDVAETGIHELILEVKRNFNQAGVTFEALVADVCDQGYLSRVFKTHKVDVIYHAAAYKHVPLMENQPHQAVRVNFLATYHLAKMAANQGVEKFVFVSTDKAVNPSNVMGASKRLAEMCLSMLQENNPKTAFVSVRFGNVLGSNGSVIPLFKKQIEAGGPITITHKEVTRYFMTIPEASQLVLEAGAMGKGGELFLLEMGESVKIYDLVKKMVHFSGLELHKDIQIKYTGLRPGEKLYEELLGQGEDLKETHNPKIKISETKKTNGEALLEFIQALGDEAHEWSSMDVVQGMKRLIPEYKSENSVFKTLDK